MIPLEDDDYCFACGMKNPIGLKLSFSWDGEVLKTSFTPDKSLQGYKDIVHGGIISTVLDECMAHAAIRKLGAMAATVEFSVRLRAPLMVGEEAVAEARTGKTGRLMEASSVLTRVSDGKTIATATARLIRQ